MLQTYVKRKKRDEKYKIARLAYSVAKIVCFELRETYGIKCLAPIYLQNTIHRYFSAFYFSRYFPPIVSKRYFWNRIIQIVKSTLFLIEWISRAAIFCFEEIYVPINRETSGNSRDTLNLRTVRSLWTPWTFHTLDLTSFSIFNFHV